MTASGVVARTRPRWSPGLVSVLLAGVGLSAIVRVLLLPTHGLRGDLDQFVAWVHGIATAPLGRAYDLNIGFPPVMVYLWAALAALQPAFQTVTDAGDPAIRILMKLPATIADFGLAAGVAYAQRARPVWAVVGALGILLSPAIIDVSAWWGQYESIYVLAALAAYLLAISERPHLAAIALAVSLMTKPQALPFVVPFAAWFLGRYGLATSVRIASAGAVAVVVLWLPFLPFGGPISYLTNVATYQGDVFGVLSLRTWNPWWLVQEAYGGHEFISDSAPVIGPLTLRHIGYVLAALLELVVFAAVWRTPTPKSLALGLAASTLVAITALTSMHERYAYAAIVFLALALPDRRVLGLWVALSVVLTLNLLAAIPPTPDVARVLPIFGPLGVIGSIAMTVVALVTLRVVIGLSNRGAVPLFVEEASRAPT